VAFSICEEIMTDNVELKAELREKVGSLSAAKLRAEGKCPAVVYGHGQDSVSIALNAHDFVAGLHHGQRLFSVSINGKKENLLVKDLQYDHLGQDVIHVDFMRVNLAETVHVTVDVEVKGTAPGTNDGGILEVHLDKLDIECKVSEIPETIECSVKELQIGETIHAGDIELSAGMKLVTDADAVVISCHVVAAAKSEEDMEGEMLEGPEVITEKDRDEEGN
jgi:large subunit ribosomal protein L25